MPKKTSPMTCNSRLIPLLLLAIFLLAHVIYIWPRFMESYQWSVTQNYEDGSQVSGEVVGNNDLFAIVADRPTDTSEAMFFVQNGKAFQDEDVWTMNGDFSNLTFSPASKTFAYLNWQWPAGSVMLVLKRVQPDPENGFSANTFLVNLNPADLVLGNELISWSADGENVFVKMRERYLQVEVASFNSNMMMPEDYKYINSEQYNSLATEPGSSQPQNLTTNGSSLLLNNREVASLTSMNIAHIGQMYYDRVLRDFIVFLLQLMFVLLVAKVVCPHTCRK